MSTHHEAGAGLEFWEHQCVGKDLSSIAKILLAAMEGMEWCEGTVYRIGMPSPRLAALCFVVASASTLTDKGIGEVREALRCVSNEEVPDLPERFTEEELPVYLIVVAHLLMLRDGEGLP